MDNLNFEWDQKKSTSNLLKHEISFEEAQTVFYDENAILFYDPDHSEDEDRFILLGISRSLNLLVVCHCHVIDKNLIRIISARKATKKESGNYGGMK